MKKMLIGCFLTVLLISGCGTNASNESTEKSSETKTSTNESSSSELLNSTEFEQMFTDPKKFKGRSTDFFAKVFTEPEKDEDGVYLQVWADPESSEKNAIIGYNDPSFQVKNGDLVHVQGTVHDVYEGENAFGGKIIAPLITASSVELADYISALSPTLQTITVNQEIDQHGYVINLEKVEFAEKETRFYISIKNNTASKISFYDFNAKLIQNSTQFEPTDNYEADYKDIQSEILPEVMTDGVILFGKLDPSAGEIKLLLEGSSEDWDLDFEPFQYNVNSN